MVQGLSPAVQKDFRDDLLVANAPGFLTSDADITPVRAIGSGIARNNARQAVKTYLVMKAVATTTYTQIATATNTLRVFFLGAIVDNPSDGATGIIYIEDADTGNIAPSDNSTVALALYGSNSFGSQGLGQPRECKRGIRVLVVKETTENTSAVVYYLEERTDGQQEAL